MPRHFEKLDLAGFTRRVQDFAFTRVVDAVHLHHTYRPNHAGFHGEQSIIGMWRYHTEKNGWSDIAQHVTVDPSGAIWPGRDWNRPPASATSHNGSGERGPFMIEVVGDFDRGKDVFGGRQKEATLGVIVSVLDRFGLPSRSLRFHREFSTKTCPGETLDLDGITCEVAALRRVSDRSFAPAASWIEPLGCGENGVGASPRRRSEPKTRETASMRALCVGINDYADGPLCGCIQDAADWSELFAMHGFQVQTLLDREATREAVLSTLREMVQAARRGDVIAFQFSGHGTLVYDRDGDEAKRGDPTPFDDEALLPFDWETGAYILDDDMEDIFADLAPGVTARVFIDACHTGYFRQFAAHVPPPPDQGARVRFIRATDRMIGRHEAFRATLSPRRQRTEPAAGVASFSACESYQVALEVNGRGVFSAAALRVLAQGSDMSNQVFVEQVIGMLGPNSRQTPVLDCVDSELASRVLPAYVGAEKVLA